MSLALGAAHALFLAGVLLFGGAAFFGAYVLPRASAGQGEARGVRALAGAGGFAALAGLVGWLAAETVTLAGDLGGIGVVLRATLFGHLVLLQGACLLAGLAALVRGFRLATAAAALALAAEAAHGHGMAMGRPGLPILIAGVVHLWSAAIWVGGLPPLLLLVRAAPLAIAGRAARWFSPPGRVAVVGVAASALVQAALLVGSPAALFATPYGLLVQAKVALFLALLAGACLNRYHLAPRLAGAASYDARRHMAATIFFQTACGILAILVAVFLGASTPGMDMDRT